MLKKRILIFVLALGLVLSLAACGSGKDSGQREPFLSGGAADDPAQTQPEESDGTTPEETRPEETQPEGLPEFTGAVDLDAAVTPPADDFLYNEFGNYVEIYGYRGREPVIVLPKTLTDKPVTCSHLMFSAGTDVHGVVIDEGFETIIGFSCETGEAHLEAVRIPASVEKVPDENPYSNLPRLHTIEVAEGNGRFRAEDGVLYAVYSDSQKLVCYPAARPGDTFVQPDGVYAGDAAYSGTVYLKRLENAYTPDHPYADSSIEEIVYSDRQTSLHSQEFYGAENLRKITMSVNLNSHAGNSPMFGKNSSLEEIVVTEGNTKYFTSGGVLYYIKNGAPVLLYYPTARPGEEYTLADGTVSIFNVDYAFDDPLYLKVLHTVSDFGPIHIDGIEVVP